MTNYSQIDYSEYLDNLDYIKNRIMPEDAYMQLAEEAAELSQAACKMARIIKGSNPTPVSEVEATNHLIEEFGDVMLIASDMLHMYPSIAQISRKAKRWKERLEAMESRDENKGHIEEV